MIDINPGNLLVTSSGGVIIIDYETSQFYHRQFDIICMFAFYTFPADFPYLKWDFNLRFRPGPPPSADERREFLIAYLDEYKKLFELRKGSSNEIEFDDSEDGPENLENFEMEVDFHLLLRGMSLRKGGTEFDALKPEESFERDDESEIRRYRNAKREFIEKYKHKLRN